MFFSLDLYSDILRQGLLTLGVVVTYVIIKKNIFHGKCILNANHNHNQYLYPINPLLYVVNHPQGGCSCSSGITTLNIPI